MTGKLKITEIQYRSNGSNRRNWAAKSRLYIWPKGEGNFDNLYLPQAYRPLLPEIWERTGINVEHASWSQRAGCTCPCSPGFILHGQDGGWGVDIHVTVEEVPVNIPRLKKAISGIKALGGQMSSGEAATRFLQIAPAFGGPGVGGLPTG